MNKVLLSVLSVACLCFSASVNLTGTIHPAGTSDFEFLIQFPESGERQFCLNLSAPPGEVQVTDRSGLPLDYTVKDSAVCTTVPYDFLRYRVYSDSFTSKNASLWTFDLGTSASENISQFSSVVVFPPGTVLKSTNGAVSGEGSSLSIAWEAEGIDTSHKAHIRAGYEVVPAGDSNIAAIILAVLVIFAIPVIHYMVSRHPHKQEEVSTLESNKIFRSLDEVDKEIMREVYNRKGKTTQARIYLETHIPKATLSRRLASLENRGLLVKSKKGNRNLLTLGDALKTG
ncbi:hypothetical protein GF318_02825 [Candidatus Micrarchaeota archaeon]|nr:hypothetical protein [Candidatus Micrarchaeota archaeon]